MVISSFSVLCLRSSCCAEGGWQQRYLQPMWLHLENLTYILNPPVPRASYVYFLYLHKIPHRCKGYSGFVTIQPCCQSVSCSDSKNMWTFQWYVFPHEVGLGLIMICRKSTFVRLVWRSWRGLQVEMGYQEGWTYVLILESNNVSFCQIEIELTHRIIPEQLIDIHFFKKLSIF